MLVCLGVAGATAPIAAPTSTAPQPIAAPTPSAIAVAAPIIASTSISPRAATPSATPGPVPGVQQSGVGAAIRGRVRLADGPLPGPERFENTIDPEGCGRWRTRQDVRVDPDERGVADVVVAVLDPPAAAVSRPGPERLTLDHRDCRFEPRVAVLTVGGVIETVNRDRVIHTAHLHGALQGNLALPLHGQSVTVTAHRPGLITVLCDLHRWMRAYVRVDTHPFHAVTDATGRFRISGLPPDEYELEIWHERLGRHVRTVTAGSGSAAELQIVLPLPGTPPETR